MTETKRQGSPLSKESAGPEPKFYRYTRLESTGEIRLLQILPGAFNDPIQIEVNHAILDPPNEKPVPFEGLSLEEVQETLSEGWLVHETRYGQLIFEDTRDGMVCWEHPDPSFDASRLPQTIRPPAPATFLMFDALSYVWGQEKDRVFIHVLDPVLSGIKTVLEVRPSLALALRYLRYTEAERTIWIDAICINQNDIEERNIQVQGMWKIYEYAHRIVAWLGAEVEGSKSAIEALKNIGSEVVELRDFRLLPSPGSSGPFLHETSQDIDLTEDVWRAIYDLIDRPYFERLWIISEIALSAARLILQCGRDQLEMQSFSTAMTCICGKETEQYEDLSNLSYYVKSSCADLSLAPFDRLLTHFQYRKGQDPRDKIYALLCLAHSKLREQTKVDYSLSYSQAFQASFLATCGFYHRLDLLALCCLDSRKLPGPSWVPDLSTPTVQHRAHSFGSGFSRFEISNRSETALDVVGLQCCVVGSVSHPGLDDEDVLDVLRRWFPSKELGNTYPTGEVGVNAFIATVSLDSITVDRWPNTAGEPLEVMTEYVASRIQSDDDALGNSERGGVIMRGISDTVNNRDFLCTPDGYFGVGPGCAQEGDVVCAILGCGELMLLRETENDTYQVVGDCYFRGFEDSIGLLGPLPSPWRVRMVQQSEHDFQVRFYNPASGEETIHDPRLPALPLDWKHISTKRTNEDPLIFEKFKNSTTGEVMNSDPRMLPDELIKRGVQLQTFTLV